VNELAAKQFFDRDVAAMQAAAKLRAWKVNEVTYPMLDVSFDDGARPGLRLRVHADEWNERPASFELLQLDGQPLTRMPQGHSHFHASHPSVARPFICMAGTREYHSHPSHVGDHWNNYRTKPGFDLGGLVGQVWALWKKST